ncbi:UNVERIFIED_CONTAM: hypothetical protein FKN15_049052 [Acipenser sinensis]
MFLVCSTAIDPTCESGAVSLNLEDIHFRAEGNYSLLQHGLTLNDNEFNETL